MKLSSRPWVSSGRYHYASEVLREGLRLVVQREALEAAKLKALHAAAEIGFGDLDQGRCHDIPDDELEQFMIDLGRRASEKGAAPG
jgi:antitoxin ParD1/3/4